MSDNREQLCPWCQTLITWDPDIGPEKECPHCFNELNGGYRSVNVRLGDQDDEDDEDEELMLGDEDALHIEDLEDFREDEYGETVQGLIDSQEEAPECPGCHDFMLHTGSRRVEAGDYTPAVHRLLPEPLLLAPFTLNVFICPHCFRFDHVLSVDDRLKITRLLRGDK